MGKEIKIYVANLAAYNNGEMKGGWFTLPTPMDEIFEVVFSPHELDEDGQPHGDWAIHDFEAPFEIHEYSSIDQLNEIAEIFELLTEKQIDAVMAMYKYGVCTDLTEAKQDLEKVIWFHDCKDMSDVARHYLENQYNEEEYPLFFRYFDFDAYGAELQTSGTFIFVNDDILEYVG
ncbi:antirestriction protein ArdA [Butyricicoccus sp. 1XD8-22]|nr:antirestriction protein ArdA [Butyricicoccus sp. 1XD8-22]